MANYKIGEKPNNTNPDLQSKVLIEKPNELGVYESSTIRDITKSKEIAFSEEITFNGETKSQVTQTSSLNFNVAASQPNAPSGSGVHYHTFSIIGNSTDAITTSVPISNNQSFDNTKENTFVVSYDPDKTTNKAIGYIGKVPIVAEPTQPLYVSSEIGNVDDQTLSITVDQNSNYDITGLSISTDSATPLNIVANTAGDGTATGNYSLDRAVISTETLTLTASVSNGITGVNGGLTMVDFTNESIVNSVMPSSIIAFYDFEDNLNDSTGQQNALTVKAGSGQPDIYNLNHVTGLKSLEFPIIGDRKYFSDWIVPNSFTIAFYFFYRNNTQVVRQRAIGRFSTGNGPQVFVESNTNDVNFKFGGSISSVETLNDATWNKIVISYTEGETTKDLWINDVKETFACTAQFGAYTELVLGDGDENVVNGPISDGYIDTLKVFNEKLTDQDILAL